MGDAETGVHPSVERKRQRQEREEEEALHVDLDNDNEAREKYHARKRALHDAMRNRLPRAW